MPAPRCRRRARAARSRRIRGGGAGGALRVRTSPAGRSRACARTGSRPWASAACRYRDRAAPRGPLSRGGGRGARRAARRCGARPGPARPRKERGGRARLSLPGGGPCPRPDPGNLEAAGSASRPDGRAANSPGRRVPPGAVCGWERTFSAFPAPVVARVPCGRLWVEGLRSVTG